MNDDVYGKNIVLDHNWLAQFSTDFSKILINISRRWWHFSPSQLTCAAKKKKKKKNLKKNKKKNKKKK